MDKTDIQLYLQKQSSCRMQKVTVFIENTLMSAVLSPMLVFVLFYAFVFTCTSLTGFGNSEFHRVMEFAGYGALVCVGCLVITSLFCRGYLPKVKALLTVNQIEFLYKAAKEIYTNLNYAPEDEYPAIEYLNAIVMSGAPMNAAHARTVNAMLAQAMKSKSERDARLKVEQDLHVLTDSIAETGLIHLPALENRNH